MSRTGTVRKGKGRRPGPFGKVGLEQTAGLREKVVTVTWDALCLAWAGRGGQVCAGSRREGEFPHSSAGSRSSCCEQGRSAQNTLRGFQPAWPWQPRCRSGASRTACRRPKPSTGRPEGRPWVGCVTWHLSSVMLPARGWGTIFRASHVHRGSPPRDLHCSHVTPPHLSLVRVSQPPKHSLPPHPPACWVLMMPWPILISVSLGPLRVSSRGPVMGPQPWTFGMSLSRAKPHVTALPHWGKEGKAVGSTPTQAAPLPAA